MIDRQSLKQFENKKVRIFLNNKNWYTGYIVKIDESSFDFLDKFQCHLTFSFDIVAFIIEIKEVHK